MHYLIQTLENGATSATRNVLNVEQSSGNIHTCSKLVVAVSEKKSVRLFSVRPSDVREVRQMSVQKLSEAGVCPKIVLTLTIDIMLFISSIWHPIFLGCLIC